MIRAALILSAMTLTACHPGIQTGSPMMAPADAIVRSTTGDSLGVVTFESTSTGLHITGTLRGLPAGPHGIHLHAVGRCDAPDFGTAGGHVNPANTHHGLENPAGPHAGDLPNIVANSGGVATVDVTTDRTGMVALSDADGTAIVVHATQDDQRTDPAGSSGARIACGVLAKRA